MGIASNGCFHLLGCEQTAGGPTQNRLEGGLSGGVRQSEDGEAGHHDPGPILCVEDRGAGLATADVTAPYAHRGVGIGRRSVGQRTQGPDGDPGDGLVAGQRGRGTPVDALHEAQARLGDDHLRLGHRDAERDRRGTWRGVVGVPHEQRESTAFVERSEHRRGGPCLTSAGHHFDVAGVDVPGP